MAPGRTNVRHIASGGGGTQARRPVRFGGTRKDAGSGKCYRLTLIVRQGLCQTSQLDVARLNLVAPLVDDYILV